MKEVAASDPCGGYGFETAECPLGCNCDDKTVLELPDRLHGLPGVFRVVKCRGCGLMRTSPRPTQARIGKFYPDDYAPFRETASSGASATHGAVRKAVRKRLDRRVTALPPLPVGRALEVGCASGSFLEVLRDAGWDAMGIELSSLAADAARRKGFDIHVGDVESAPAPDQPFDLIVAWMVVEHLHDPLQALRLLRTWAAPSAWLVLSVPNAAAWERRLFRSYWYAWQTPTHLYHFTPKTLDSVLRLSGWRVEKVIHQRVVTNIIASLGYRIREIPGFNNLGELLAHLLERYPRLHDLFYPLATALAALRQSGRITLWARRA